MPLQVSKAFMRSRLFVIGSSDFSSKTRQEHKAMMLLASMSAKTFWKTILSLQQLLKTNTSLQISFISLLLFQLKTNPMGISWYFNWSPFSHHYWSPTCELQRIFLHFVTDPLHPHRRTQSPRTLRHQNLVRGGDLAGHAALQLHHAVLVDEFQPGRFGFLRRLLKARDRRI